MTSMSKGVFIFSCCVLFSSCATIITGSNATLTIDGSVDAPVTVRTAENAYEFDSLPQQIKVLRKNLGCSIEISTDSAQSVSVVPETKMNNWFWGNLLFSGLAGMLVDGVTYNYQRPRYDTFVIQATDSMGYPRLSVERYPIAKSVIPRIYHHEIGGHIGFGSNVDRNRVNTVGDFLEQHYGYEQSYLSSYFDPFSLGLHYYYHFNEQWALGLEYAFAHGYRSYYELGDKDVFGPCNVLVRSHLIMAGCKWQWIDSDVLRVCSKVALGVQRRHVYCVFDKGISPGYTPDDKKWLMAYQIAPLYVEFGRRSLRYFLQLGYGNEGIFSFGINKMW